MMAEDPIRPDPVADDDRPRRIVPLRDVAVSLAADGSGCALRLTNRDGGTFETALTGRGLDRFVALVLSALQELATEDASGPSMGAHEFTPLRVSAVSLGTASDPAETILTMHLGPLSLGFAVPGSALPGLLRAAEELQPPEDRSSLN